MNELLDLKAASELMYPDLSCWKHYKGSVYVIEGRTINENDGISLIYRRVDGPDYDRDVERDLYFSRPQVEWIEFVNDVPRFIPHEDMFSNVDFDMEDDLYLKLAKRAHSEGITFNRVVENMLTEAIRNNKGNINEGRFG